MKPRSMFDGTNFFWAMLGMVVWVPMAYSSLHGLLSSARPSLDSPDLPGAIMFTTMIAFQAVSLIQMIAVRRVTGIADPYSTVSLKNGLSIPITHFALCISLVVVALVDFHQAADRQIALYIAPFLLLCGSFGLVVRLITPRPALKLSAEGLEYSTYRIGPIRWDDIVQVDAKQVLGRKYVVEIRLRNAAAYIRRSTHSWIGKLIFVRQLKNSTLKIPTQVFGVDADELAEAIKMRREVLSF